MQDYAPAVLKAASSSEAQNGWFLHTALSRQRRVASVQTGPRRQLQSVPTFVSEPDSCEFIWSDGVIDDLAIALDRHECSSVLVKLEASRKLFDTAQLPKSRVVNITILGKVLPDGSLPQLLMNPRGRVKTAPGSLWHFESVEVVAMSLDWLSPVCDEDPLQVPSCSSAQSSTPFVRVSMANAVLRSVQCDRVPENDLAHAWLQSMMTSSEDIRADIATDSTFEVDSPSFGRIQDMGWVDVAPWTPSPAAVQYRLVNTTVACAPADDATLGVLVNSTLTQDVVPSAPDCYMPTDHGQSYRGPLATTETGRACVRWDEGSKPGGGNVFADPLLRNSGLEENACRNPLGVLDRPWCFVDGAPYIERCAVDACVPLEAPAASVRSPSWGVWVRVLVVICSIAGVLLIALLLVLLVRALWGGSLCPTLTQGGRRQGRSKREGASSDKTTAELSSNPRNPHQNAPASPGTSSAASSPVDAAHCTAGSVPRHPSSKDLLLGGSAAASSRSRSHTHSPPSMAPADPQQLPKNSPTQAEAPARAPEPQVASGLARFTSVSHTRSSQGDGRSNASSHTLRPTTPSLHHSNSSHAEAPSTTGSPMHSKPRPASSDYGYTEWHGVIMERPQQSSAQGAWDEAVSVDAERCSPSASPTLQHIMERSSLHRTDATNGAITAPQDPRKSSAGMSPREGDLRQRTIEEELVHMHDAGHRGMVYSVDSRSYATSSLQDAVSPAAFASGAVTYSRTIARTGAGDLQHTTEVSTIVLDTPSATAADPTNSGSVGMLEPPSRDRSPLYQQATSAPEVAAATARNLSTAAAAAVAGVQGGWGAAYRRPDIERTISGSWTNSNSSPTGTLASRVAMQSPAGASCNMSAGELGAGFETFQSDRDSLTSHYQVNLWEHDIKLGKRLGRGSFAQVFQGLWNDTAVAIKVIEYNEGDRDAVDPCMEASLTKELTHPNVVITYDFGWTSHEINSLLSVRPESIVMVILMEYCNLKSLASNIRQTNRFVDESGASKWVPIAHTLIDILRGLTYLHDMDIIHGDIKAANVMLKSVHKTVSPVKFTAKLADLGLAQLRGDPVSVGTVGSLTHAAPELLNQSRCNTPQSDVYAFGVLMWELISGKEPYKGLSMTDLIRLKTSTRTADTLVMEARDDPICTAFAEIFHQCVASEPAARPTCKDLFKQLRAVASSFGLSSQTSAAHYRSIRICPDSCSSPSKEMFALGGAKALSLASQSSRYSRSPRSADAHSAAQAATNQGHSGFMGDHAFHPHRRSMPYSASSHVFAHTPMHMRSQVSPRTMSARSGWRSPSATSPHNSLHGSPCRSPRRDQHPFSYDHARTTPEEARALLGVGPAPRSGTPASLSGAMSPTHSEHTVPFDMRRPEPARSGSVASSTYDTIRSSLTPSAQADLGERMGSFNARQRAQSTGVLSASSQPPVPSPLVAYRQAHLYATGAAAGMAMATSSEAGYPVSAASNNTSSARMSRCMRDAVSEHHPCTPQPLSSRSVPNSSDHHSDFMRSISAHHSRASTCAAAAAPNPLPSPPGSQQLDGSVPGSMEGYSALYSNPAAVLSTNDVGDETAPEDGDSSSDESHRGMSRGGQRGQDNSEMAATQAALGGLDSTDSFADRRQLNLGSVDSFNLEMGNSSNLQRLMRDHSHAHKGALLADAASGPSGGPSGISLTLEAHRVAGTTIPEASVAEGTLDAIRSASTIRRAGSNSASVRRQLLRPGYRAGTQRGGVDSDHSGFGNPPEGNSASVGHWTSTLTAQSSGTMSLNLWAQNSSQPNSLMHDDCLQQGQALAGAGGGSFSTDADAQYPVQSIMESMRYMQSVAGNSSFMPQGKEHGGPSASWLGPGSSAANAQPPSPLSDAQPALARGGMFPTADAVRRQGDRDRDGAVATGSPEALAAHQLDSRSLSTQEHTTQSSRPGESSQQTGASSSTGAPGWVRTRSGSDPRFSSGDGARASSRPSRLSSGSVQSSSFTLQPAASHPFLTPLAGVKHEGRAGAAVRDGEHLLPPPHSFSAVRRSDGTNGASTHSASAERLGLSPASQQHSTGPHAAPFMAGAGSLSNTLSHHSLSPPPQPAHCPLNDTTGATGGQSGAAPHSQTSHTSLTYTPPAPEQSQSGRRMPSSAGSLARGPSQKPLTASMLHTSAQASAGDRASSGLVSLTSYGPVWMDESIQGVQEWLQHVPDPSDTMLRAAAPSSPTSSGHLQDSARATAPTSRASMKSRRGQRRSSGQARSKVKATTSSASTSASAAVSQRGKAHADAPPQHSARAAQ